MRTYRAAMSARRVASSLAASSTKARMMSALLSVRLRVSRRSRYRSSSH